MKSVMIHNFSNVPDVNIERSVIDLSNGYKTTFNAGYLIPFFNMEALPGDTIHMQATVFARLLTPIVPFMDNLWLDTFYFSVPNRLLWDHWVNFMGEKADPDDETEYLLPYVNILGTSAGGTQNIEHSINDYFGNPLYNTYTYRANALPFRAVNLIWNEWFRDQNLQDRVPVNKGDGPDANVDYQLLKRGKRHDYFTSCLPQPQKGDAIQIPLGTTAPVVGDGKAIRFDDGVNNSYLYRVGAADQLYSTTQASQPLKGASMTTNSYSGASYLALGLGTTATSGMVADLSNATAATINSLREAFQLQRMLERDMRSGSRYSEVLRAQFGVNKSDHSWRPEYIGGSSQLISINSVAQTSGTPVNPTTGDPVYGTAQGNLSAYGMVADGKGGFHKSFDEHCTIIGFCCVRADLTYQQGLNRMWSRRTRYDYYWPALAHLGEQEVLNKEIYFADDADQETYNNKVWGYQERYAEYRYRPSMITGKFRSVLADSLDVWHLSQNLSSKPTLSAEFIEEDPPISRVVAVSGEPQFKMDCYFKTIAARPMPVYSVPGLIDHL